MEPLIFDKHHINDSNLLKWSKRCVCLHFHYFPVKLTLTWRHVHGDCIIEEFCLRRADITTRDKVTQACARARTATNLHVQKHTWTEAEPWQLRSREETKKKKNDKEGWTLNRPRNNSLCCVEKRPTVKWNPYFIFCAHTHLFLVPFNYLTDLLFAVCVEHLHWECRMGAVR